MRHTARLWITDRWERLPASMRGVGVVYGGLCLVLWTQPLLRILHVEASAVVAAVAFFAAGTAALRAFADDARPGPVLAGQLAALGVPWALLTVTLLWTPNCDYARGLLFFLLFPGISVVLAVGVARALAGIRRARAVFWGLGLAVALVTPLYDLGLHPQFYVYNHVFGGVLGPVYDEELALRPGLFVFRGLSLCWAGLGFAVGAWRAARRAGRPGRGAPAVAAGLALIVTLAYVRAVPLGLNTTGAALARALGGVYHSAHFDLYYDPAALDEEAVARLAADHEYRYAQLARRLAVPGPPRIASFLYPDAGTKARLTGAGRTNVAPVWLRQPQVHVLLPAYEAVFPHELAHVFSREFGLPVLRASWSVGLVEGLAVALEPPDGLPSPHDQVLAAALRPDGATPGLAERVARRLSPLGFWTGRGAVSYTTMGSFVRYLLDAYGAERLKRVYARADFEAVYGKPAPVLAAEWVAYLRRRPVMARAAAPLARARFAVPSLFEKRCPHYVPPYRQAYRDGQAALAAGDTAAALARFEAALAARPRYADALAAWAGLRLARGEAAAVVARLDTLPDGTAGPSVALRLGDALAVTGHVERARAVYEAAWRRLPLYAREFGAWLVLRKSLARNPAVMRILTGAASPAAQAEALAAYRATDPAVGFAVAWRRAAAGEYDRAVETLRRTPPLPETVPPARRALVERVRGMWLARFLHRAGDLTGAAAEAARAAAAFREAGDLDAAALMDDRAAELRWLAGPVASRRDPFARSFVPASHPDGPPPRRGRRNGPPDPANRR